MRTFKTKWFARYARQEKLADSSLGEAVLRANRGLVDADLGGHLIKQRVARSGEGRSGGYRVLIAFEASKRAVFLLGFAKNERDNISGKELESLKRIGAQWLAADAGFIERSIEEGVLVEMSHGN
jgi:hypothetical protein